MDVRTVPPETAPFMESVPRARHRKVVLALLLSLALHGLVFLYLQAAIEWGWGETTRPGYPTLEVRMRQTPSASPRVGEPSVAESSPVQSPVTPAEIMDPEPAPADSPEAAATGRPGLVLELPDMPGDDRDAMPAPGATDNGATVMSGELLDQLNRARRRSGYRPGTGRAEPGEFQAGNWVEYIRDGDRCFRVVRADPLQPGSVDMWYRVACG